MRGRSREGRSGKGREEGGGKRRKEKEEREEEEEEEGRVLNTEAQRHRGHREGEGGEEEGRATVGLGMGRFG